jgi:hypothetical protein
VTDGFDTISVPINACQHCGYKWTSIKLGQKLPKRCPNQKCQSYYWQREADKKQPHHKLQDLYGQYLRGYNATRDGAMLTMREWRERFEAERLERRAARLAARAAGE